MGSAHLSFFKKLFFTLKTLKKTAHHHYGDNVSSIPKFFYYYLFKSNTFLILVFDLAKNSPTLGVDSHVEVISPTLSELAFLRQGKILPREFYYDRIHGVKKCYVTLCEGVPACIHWVYLKGDYNRFLKLGDGVAELNYITTLPRFRGRRVMAETLVHILLDLKKQGYLKAVLVMNAENPPAIKSALRAGFVEWGSIKTFGPFHRKTRISNA